MARLLSILGGDVVLQDGQRSGRAPSTKFCGAHLPKEQRAEPVPRIPSWRWNECLHRENKYGVSRAKGTLEAAPTLSLPVSQHIVVFWILQLIHYRESMLHYYFI